MSTTPKPTEPLTTSSLLPDFGRVLPENLFAVWDHAAPILKKAIDRTSGRYGLSDVKKFIAQGKQQLWLAIDGKKIKLVLITEVVRYPRRRACMIAMAAGEDRKLWMDHLPTVEKWAMKQGCDVIEELGREGWGKDLDKRGYRKVAVMYEKDLTCH